MIRDDLAGLSLFVAVAENRSFTAAAAALRVTPSAISQGISALEERLGVRLLQRTTRSVSLTEAGQHFLDRLRPALADVRSAFDALETLKDRPTGTLRLNVPRYASERLIEPRLAEFMAAYPEISLDISVDDGFTDIVERGFDAGIRLGEWLDREMVAVRVSADERMAVVGSPSYFARHGKPKHPRDLHEHDCVNYRRITTRIVYAWEFTENGRDFEVAVNGRLLCNDGELMLRAAIDGVGLAYVVESRIGQELADRQIVRVLEEFCPPFPGLFLYYPSRAHVPPKLAALVEFLRWPRGSTKPSRKSAPSVSRPR